MRNWSIKKQGLLVFSGIFLLEITLVLLLAGLNFYAELAAAQSSSLSDYLRIACTILQDTAFTWTGLVDQFTSKELIQGLELTPLQYRQRCAINLQQISLLPFKSSRAEEIELLLHEIIEVQSDAFERMAKVEDIRQSGPAAYVQRVRKISAKLSVIKGKVQRVNALLQQELEELNSTRIRNAKLRQLVKVVLMISIAVQFFIAYLVIQTFFSRITAKLQMLLENAKAIPSGRQLKHTLSEYEELAYLDQSLHESADILISAARSRKNILAMVAHDIRGPLTSALMQVDSLSSKIGRTPTGEVSNVNGTDTQLGQSPFDLISQLKQTLTTQKQLLDDLLDSEKLESGEFNLSLSIFDMQDIIDEVIKLNLLTSDQKQLCIHTCGTHVEVLADRNRVLQLLNSLVTSAIASSPHGGNVDVTCRISISRLLVKIAHEKNDGKHHSSSTSDASSENLKTASKSRDPIILLSLDIESKDLLHSFSICKAIAEKHGGLFSIRDKDEPNSVFWFTLPYEELE